ncbi:MAG: 2-isopropylmalate synthase [Sulfurospirillum sp.]|nr:2-isopropylmalate synthase [Sulfurospirillum sp.]MBL0703238.1 2-isopropylmalate synthase [Sulfurospirillum sp.]
MKTKNIIIFDTTLRDGEQSPGASMNAEEKTQLALQLEKLGVDVIEAGFAVASPGDFDAIRRISDQVKSSVVCSLARALDNDIKVAADAISSAKFQRIHTFIATSPIHMKYKLKMTPEEVIKKAVNAVAYAKTFCNDIEFSCEDAGRSDIVFMKEILDAVIEAGATTLNIPDTVGYRMPSEMGAIIKTLHKSVGDRAIISVHNHNDLGVAVASSIESILNGARQVECTINGLGERAGNAALEEIVMALRTRHDIFGEYDTNININEIYHTSRLVSTITGIEPQPNKAIVGKNAFLHESGIHQNGVLKHMETYEIMKASDIGFDINSIVLGKHSGRYAFKDKLTKLGFHIKDSEIDKIFVRFKILADAKKEIFDEDIRALVSSEISKVKEVFKLITLQLSDCNLGLANAAVTISYDGKEVTDAAIGNGTMDAVFKVIDRVCNIQGELRDYKVDAVTKGKNALARVMVKVIFEENKSIITGHGLSVDTMLATANAYIDALNSYFFMKGGFKN